MRDVNKGFRRKNRIPERRQRVPGQTTKAQTQHPRDQVGVSTHFVQKMNVKDPAQCLLSG